MTESDAREKALKVWELYIERLRNLPKPPSATEKAMAILRAIETFSPGIPVEYLLDSIREAQKAPKSTLPKDLQSKKVVEALTDLTKARATYEEFIAKDLEQQKERAKKSHDSVDSPKFRLDDPNKPDKYHY